MKLDANLDHDNSYKLLALTPELAKLLESSDLVVRSCHEGSGLMLCGPDATWKLRQTNNSNTALMGRYDESGEVIESFTMIPSVLDAHLVADPQLVKSHIPTYTGEGRFMDAAASKTIPNYKTNSVVELMDQMPLSDGQFREAWRYHCGTEVNGVACLLSDDVIASVLSDILLHVRTEEVQLDVPFASHLLEADKVRASEPLEVVQTVINKYTMAEPGSNLLQFEMSAIIRFYGLYILEKHASYRPITLQDFKTLWLDAIPISGDWDLDLQLLKCRCVRGYPDTVRYLSPDDLKSDPRGRFKQLFTVKPEWELSELEPFIVQIWNRSIKLENFIMKFARRRKVGTKVLVSPR